MQYDHQSYKVCMHQCCLSWMTLLYAYYVGLANHWAVFGECIGVMPVSRASDGSLMETLCQLHFAGLHPLMVALSQLTSVGCSLMLFNLCWLPLLVGLPCSPSAGKPLVVLCWWISTGHHLLDSSESPPLGTFLTMHWLPSVLT